MVMSAHQRKSNDNENMKTNEREAKMKRSVINDEAGGEAWLAWLMAVVKYQ
jgi:hypothetical protein